MTSTQTEPKKEKKNIERIELNSNLGSVSDFDKKLNQMKPNPPLTTSAIKVFVSFFPSFFTLLLNMAVSPWRLRYSLLDSHSLTSHPHEFPLAVTVLDADSLR